MMQLIAINDTAAIDINKKMSTLGEALETNNLTLDTENCTNKISQDENNESSEKVNVENISKKRTSQDNVTLINGILKISGAEIDDKCKTENKIETNGRANRNSPKVLSVESKISEDVNEFDLSLNDKEDVILTNDLKVPETKNFVGEVVSETSTVNEKVKTDRNVNDTPKDIDILISDDVTANQISAFSPNSDANEKEINISSQLQQLDDDESKEEGNPTFFMSKKTNKENIVQETELQDATLSLTRKNEADVPSLLKKKVNDEIITKTDLPGRDSHKTDAQNNGISIENKSIIDENSDEPSIISDKSSAKLDHAIIDKPHEKEASNILLEENIPLEELLNETDQKETMDIDDEKIDEPGRGGLKPNTQSNGTFEIITENEPIADKVLDETLTISGNISAKVDHAIIDEQNVEEASNLPPEENLTETNQKETVDIVDAAKETTNKKKLDDNRMLENELMDIEGPVVCSSEEHPNAGELLSDNYDSMKNGKEEKDVGFGSSEESKTETAVAASEMPPKDIELNQKDDDVMDIEDVEEIFSGKSPLPTDVDTEKPYIKIKADEALAINLDAVEVKQKQKVNVAMDIDDVKEMSSVKSALPSDTKETNIETKTEEDLAIKLDAVEVEQTQKDNNDIDIDNVEKMSSERSALPTDIDTKEINIETSTDAALAIKLDKKKQNINVIDIKDDSEISVLTSEVDTKEINTETKANEKLTTEQDPVVCQTDKNETNVKECNVVNGKVKDNETSEVISIDESENDARQDKPVISQYSIDPINNPENKYEKKLPVVCKLSNTMDILSDDEDEPPAKPIEPRKENVDKEPEKAAEENKCINLDDDDDIMFIEDTNLQDSKLEQNESQQKPQVDKTNDKTYFDEQSIAKSEEDKPTTDETVTQLKEDELIPTKSSDGPKPIITKMFLQSVSKNLAEMTRNELEDFCILKLVECVVDKSNLNEIKSKMKTMTQTLEDLRKKTMALTKQNRDLQVVVKTVQEDQKKRNTNPMMPMKITRSVGMQVVLTGEKSLQKRKPNVPTQPPPPMTPARPVRTSQSPKIQQKPPANIPVPRLVPASSPTLKPPVPPATNAKVTVKNATPQRPEKRAHNKITSPTTSSVTVDLTDDEPPSKISTKNPTPPVRLVPSQNLMPKNRPQFTPNTSNNSARESPRKVYIPISSNNPRPQICKNFAPTPRSRPPVIHPSVVRMQPVRMNQVATSNRHPAPLPDAMKQYQPPAWKALPPAPDLKLSKVDNGIVISWKFEGYQPDSYEEVASYQLYAYQETPAPPSTTLWKKIGDIKALPLPMACTLTQFMSGFKYYFAVRAIDVRSRIGPFSLPGSIMLISKS